MNIFNDQDKLKRIDQLIRLKATGTPKELAQKLKISKRTVFRIIDRLKEFGCPICYNKFKETYIYKEEGEIIIKFEHKNIKKEDLNNIKGGCFGNNYPSDKIWHSQDVNLFCDYLQNIY